VVISTGCEGYLFEPQINIPCNQCHPHSSPLLNGSVLARF
jgi:hypothetical protein